MKRSLLITMIAIAVIPLILLGAAYGLEGIARTNAQKEHVWLMETLLPGGKDFIKLPAAEDDTIRSVHQASVGYVIETVTRGYADDITLYIGINNDGAVTGLVAYDAHETAGLGNRILTDHRFLSQFLNNSGTFTVGTSDADAFSGATGESAAAGEEIAIDGISGATVSSKAVARCVNAAVAYVTGADIESSATAWGG